MFIWVALKEKVKEARILWIITEVYSNQGFRPGPQEKLAETTSSWSYDMEGHAKKCVERYCELANTTTEQLFKVATPCMDDHPFEEEEMGSVGEMSTRIGRFGILWSLNKLARAVTKWTKACDKRSASLISYIHHTIEFRQHSYVGNTAQHCR